MHLGAHAHLRTILLLQHIFTVLQLNFAEISLNFAQLAFELRDLSPNFRDLRGLCLWRRHPWNSIALWVAIRPAICPLCSTVQHVGKQTGLKLCEEKLWCISEAWLRVNRVIHLLFSVNWLSKSRNSILQIAKFNLRSAKICCKRSTQSEYF